MHQKKFAYVVYKVTFPNGKIYVGQDIGTDGHTIRYFGSWHFKAVEQDFSKEELSHFAIERTILFESRDKKEVGAKEMELIVELRANDPEFGYNKMPKFKPFK